MASIEGCFAEIRDYNALLSRLNTISSFLKKSANSLEPVRKIIYDSYSIDGGETPIIHKCTSLYNDICKYINYIDGTLIPATHSAIRRNKNDIAKLQAENRN